MLGKINRTFWLLGLVLGLSSCASHQPENIANSPYTHGNVQLTMRKGVTTKSDVLNKFGAPNITTMDATGQEIWTYQKHATVASATSSGAMASIIIASAGTGTSGFEQSSRTMTLIITFDEYGKVSDFKSMSSSF